MTKNTRRFIFFTFFLAFIIIAPAVILYAAGYKLNLKTKTIQKTGTLVIKSDPSGAEIYLNNEIVKPLLSSGQTTITTPAKIKNLLPGEYELRLDYKDHWSWSKKLKIEPGKTVMAEDIILFKKTLPVRLIDGAVDYFTISSADKLIFRKNSQLYFYNDGNEYSLTAANPEITTASWSAAGDKLIYDDLLLFAEENKSPKNLKDIIPRAGAVNFKWGETNNEIYYSADNSLYVFDLISYTTKEIIKGEMFTDYLFKDNYLALLNNQTKASQIKIFSRDGKLIVNFDLPCSTTYELQAEPSSLLSLFDERRRILYLIDPFSYNPLKEIVSDVKILTWKDKNELLYANDFEIFIFNLADRQKKLLTRISTPIEHISWYPENNYILYATTNAINALELDDRDRRNNTEILSLEKISSPQPDKNSRNIYFYSQLGQQEGIFKLNIQ